MTTIKKLCEELLAGKWSDLATQTESSGSLFDTAVRVRGGDFLVGDPAGERRTLSIADYQLSSRLVTNREYSNFLNHDGVENKVDGTYLLLNDVNVNLPIRAASDGSYDVEAGCDDRPVAGVTWIGAAVFAATVGGRLPTEAEWEIAARSGDPERHYPWGDRAPTPGDGNFGHYIGATSAADAFPANDWGFRDMSGNLRQWCLDWFTKSQAYASDSVVDTARPERVMKVVRGAVWSKGEHLLPCHVRRGKWARMGSTSTGFRVVFDDGATRRLDEELS